MRLLEIFDASSFTCRDLPVFGSHIIASNVNRISAGLSAFTYNLPHAQSERPHVRTDPIAGTGWGCPKFRLVCALCPINYVWHYHKITITFIILVGMPSRIWLVTRTKVDLKATRRQTNITKPHIVFCQVTIEVPLRVSFIRSPGSFCLGYAVRLKSSYHKPRSVWT